MIDSNVHTFQDSSTVSLCVLTKIPTWDYKTINPRSTQEIHIYQVQEGVLLSSYNCRHHWPLGPGISTTSTSLTHFMVTQVSDGRASPRKKEGKRNENKSLGAALYSHVSFLKPQCKPVGSNLTANSVISQNAPHHLENLRQNVWSSLNLQNKIPLSSGGFKTLSLSPEYIYMCVECTLVVVGKGASLVCFLFSTNPIKILKSPQDQIREKLCLHLEMRWIPFCFETVSITMERQADRWEPGLGIKKDLA